MAARVSLLSSVFVALAQLTSQAAAANGYSVSTSGGTTYMPILGTQTIASGYAASVVAADACSTTYVLACTDSLQCNTQIQGSGTVTEGPYFLAATAQTVLDGATGTGIITCNNDQSSATCTVSEKGVKGSNTFTTALTVSLCVLTFHFKSAMLILPVLFSMLMFLSLLEPLCPLVHALQQQMEQPLQAIPVSQRQPMLISTRLSCQSLPSQQQL